MQDAHHWQRNLWLLNAISFTRTFMVIMPIFVPLMASYGLTMQQTMLLQSIFAGVTLVMELPSGYMADVFGRKQTLVLGYIITGMGFSQLLWADTFIQLAIFEATLGLAMSFISGCDTALAYESEKALQQNNAQPAISRLLSWMNFGEGIAAFVAFVLIKYDLRWLLWTQAVVGWAPFVFSFWLVEPPKLDINRHANKSMKEAVAVIMKTPMIGLLTTVFVATMSVTYLVAWLNQNLWQAEHLPLAYFGLVWGTFSFIVGFAARFSGKLPTQIGPLKVFTWLACLLLAGYLALLTSNLVLILFGGALICVFRGIAAPKIKLQVNNAIDNEYRATVNSVVGASFRIATLILGPAMGFVVDQYSALTATSLLVVLIVPAIAGLVLLDKRFVSSKVELAA